MSVDAASALEHARELCANAEAVLVTSGAGMGVDSGLPDFRGNEGFWNAYPPYRKLGFSFVEMANPDRFRDEPELGWGFYGHRQNLYRATRAQDGFAALLAYGESRSGGYFSFTSNVDGHFQASGFDRDRVIECHGSIHHLQCLENCCGNIWAAPNDPVEIDESTMRANVATLPRCGDCGGLTRPNILMFGDWGWDSARCEEQSKRYESWLRSLVDSAARLVVLVFGAGTAVPTVRMQSEKIATAIPNATLIRVNLREPEVDSNGVGIAMGARETIHAILP